MIQPQNDVILKKQFTTQKYLKKHTILCFSNDIKGIFYINFGHKAYIKPFPIYHLSNSGSLLFDPPLFTLITDLLLSYVD